MNATTTTTKTNTCGLTQNERAMLIEELVMAVLASEAVDVVDAFEVEAARTSRELEIPVLVLEQSGVLAAAWERVG